MRTAIFSNVASWSFSARSFLTMSWYRLSVGIPCFSYYCIGIPSFPTHQITLVTTLIDPEVSRVADLAERYRQRWQVETLLAQLKITMRMDVPPYKTVSRVLKELTVFAIVYNLVRMVMC
jgi:IS4 transposase